MPCIGSTGPSWNADCGSKFRRSAETAMGPPEFDLGVYLVTDRACCGARSVDEVVMAAIDGGATLVQLRDKNVDAGPMLALGRRLRELLRPRGIGLIVNDRIDVAQVLDADGVHIGQQDIPYPEARRLLGPGKIIGVSIGSEAEAREAADWDVDYVGVGPVYPTATKPDAGTALGADATARLAKLSGHRAVAIGGIDATNAAPLYAAGLEGVAVISAVCGAPDPRSAARGLLRLMLEHRA
jgi:thiamine-phosphate pyrophosphorylase